MNTMKLKIEKLLKDAGVEHEFIKLPEDIAMDVDVHMKFHGKRLMQAMPNIVFRTEKGLLVVQKRGDLQLDHNKIKKAAGVKNLSFATNEDLKSVGLEPGIVAPFGYDATFFMDEKVLENDEVFTGSGDKLFAIKLSPKDVVKLNNAVVGDFTFDTRGKRVYSGIRATGRLHLGNYMGAVKGMLALQEEYDCVFSVVDLHTITVPYDVKTLAGSVRNIVLDYLAAGLDPQKCKLEIQSHVPQHTELAYLLSTIYPVSRLEDLPTYKEKKAQYPKYVNMGLLYYPVLMAADVLLYKGELVPVGIDQEPHLEVMREIARKFNSMFGQTFPEAVRFKTPGEYVPSLTGKGKMSKSVEDSYINLTDDLETIRAKVAKIPTDSGKAPNSNDYESRTECPMFGLMPFVEIFMGKEKSKEYQHIYITTGIKYKHLKEELSDAIYKELEPFQEKRKEFEQNPKLVEEILESSNKKCIEIAEETMKEVREKMGFG